MFLNALLCLGFFVGLALLVGLLLLAASDKRATRREEDTLATGRPMAAALVMANSALYDADGPECMPGVVVFAFFEPTPQLHAALKNVAERCYECYEHAAPEQLAPPYRALALRMKDHRYRESRRTLAPPEVTGGMPVYVADVRLYRERFLDGWPEHRLVACAVTGQAEGQIAHLRLESPGSRHIHSVASPETARALARVAPADPIHSAGWVSSSESSDAKARELRFYLVSGSLLLLLTFCCGGSLFGRLFFGGDEPSPPPSPVAQSGNNRSEPPPAVRSDRPSRPQDFASPNNLPGPELRPRMDAPKAKLPRIEVPKIERRKFERPTTRPPVFDRPNFGPSANPFSPPNVPNVPGVPTESPDTGVLVGSTPTGKSPADRSPPDLRPNRRPRPDPSKSLELPAALSASDQLTIPVDDLQQVSLGPPGCPFVIVGREIWDHAAGKKVAELPVMPSPHALRAFSANGEWLAVAGKSANQTDTPVSVYRTSTGERVLEVPGQAGKFVDVLEFTRDKFLVLAGRQSNAIEIWDVSTGSQRPTIQTPQLWIDAKKTTFSPDGLWFTTVAQDHAALTSTRKGTAPITLAPPPVKNDPGEALNPVQLKIRQMQAATDIQAIRFSPDGQEVAAIVDLQRPRLTCWNTRGELVLNVDVPEVKESFFFRHTLEWFPDKSGWVIAGQVFDRAAGRIVIPIPVSVVDPLLIRPLDRNRVIGVLPSDGKTLRIYQIDWAKAAGK